MSGIFEEQANVSKQLQSDKSKDSKSTAGDDSDKESSSSSKSSESDAVSERNNSVLDDNKDDGSQCNMNESAYAIIESNEKQMSSFNLTNKYTSNKEAQVNDDDDNENVYLGDEWQWNQ